MEERKAINPTGGNVSAEEAERGRQRKRRLLMLFAFSFVLSGAIATAACYGLTKRSLVMLPGVSLLAKALPPRYVFSITGMTTPEAVAVSPDGQRIYVAESGGDRLVRVYGATGREIGRLVPPGSQVAFRLPISLAVAPDGRVFVSDRLRGAIDMYTPTGEYIGSYRPEAVMDEPWLPLGLSFDARSRLLVTDHREGKHRVLVFRPNEYLDLAFGEEGQGLGQFSFPYSAAVDSSGRIYVSDSNNARLAVFDETGKPLSVVMATDSKGALGLPRGLAVDNLDRLHVVDGSTHMVVVYEAGAPPKYLFSFGSLGTASGEFRYPSGIALDQYGRIYVANRDNNAVEVWSY